ncbi:discoidin domain-containing protein [Peribacillus kribbensis]|uniref:discoidin domain-containing protein n=1 Tax=Peribacillus kribbensis TaxID=356658 RepID=UPI0003FAF691|nr:discoidin domain-containing protein [Peribacillus kribbensis]
MQKRFFWPVTLVLLFMTLLLFKPSSSHAASINEANKSPLGPNVYVFDPSMPSEDIQKICDDVFKAQETNQFGKEKYELLFKPGTYNINIKVGFYTTVAGLGKNPADVVINGGLNVDAKWFDGNATQNFWRSVENLSIKPANGVTRYAVSQAAPMRRVHIMGELQLFDFDKNWNAGWSSGGYIADSIMDKQVIPASQQQFFSRNNEYPNWTNSVWNTVMVGDQKPHAASFPNNPFTVIEKTPVIGEKPYLYMDKTGKYNVFVPDLQKNSQGVTWKNGPTPGKSLSLDTFYIADPDTSTSGSINVALSKGKNILFTPGVYHLKEPIHVRVPNTVVMGLGFATLIPDNGKEAMKVLDVDGVKIAGLLFDAGTKSSPSLLKVGTNGSHKDHSANPISLYDLFFRVGGGEKVGRAETSLEINSNDVIGDHFWIWRADHGNEVGWDVNTADNGLTVNGDDVTLYGLFVEHFQKYQVVWNGNGGRTYFYQSEIPYDVPNQEGWMSHNGTINGYASYKVSDSAASHEAWGLGVYSYFRDAAVKLHRAIEVPDRQGVNMHNMTTIWLNGMAGSEITHVINDAGGRVYGTAGNAMRQTVTAFAGGDRVAPEAPANLTASVVSSSEIKLNWSAATDNTGVSEYEIYRDGVYIGSTTSMTYSDTGLKSSTAYNYFVKAKDSSGNTSGSSNTASAVTGKAESVLDRTGWKASTNVTTSSGDPNAVLDGNSNTRWSAGQAMKAGQSLTIDMQSAKSFNRIVMDSAGSTNDYARGYEVYVSNDGVNWGFPAAAGTGSGAKVIVDFPQQNARYIKVVQTGSASSWWSIAEFTVIQVGE